MQCSHNKLFRSLSGLVSSTPFHPQWLIYTDNYKSIADLHEYIKGTVLDIGCGGRDIRQHLPDDCQYFGLDYYYTSVNWYKSSPEIYADAHNLPLNGRSIDTVFILDVLEHVRDAEKCMSEIKDVLKSGGFLILQIPFIYPIHDAPLDFKRWTIHGLKNLLEKHDFQVVREIHKGQPFETSTLLFNIAIGKTLVNWVNNKNPAALLGILFPFIFLVSNLLAVLATYLAPTDNFMPWAYRIVARKK